MSKQALNPRKFYNTDPNTICVSQTRNNPLRPRFTTFPEKRFHESLPYYKRPGRVWTVRFPVLNTSHGPTPVRVIYSGQPGPERPERKWKRSLVYSNNAVAVYVSTPEGRLRSHQRSQELRPETTLPTLQSKEEKGEGVGYSARWRKVACSSIREFCIWTFYDYVKMSTFC